jgi:cyanophycinase
MPGEIALVGGDEFRVGCEEMDREIMRASGQNPARVVVIPTAAVTGPAKAANDGVTHFARLGGDSQQLMVLEQRQANDPALLEGLSEAGVIYFTGGNPDHLLETLHQSELLAAIRRAVAGGAVLAGSSAGAMVMGALMRRPRRGGWVPALGLTPNIAVLPHHEGSDPAETSRQLLEQVPASLTVLGIDARSGCLGSPGHWRAVGSGQVTVYRNGEWQVYQAGQTLAGDF